MTRIVGKCFWCDAALTGAQLTRDHLISTPLADRLQVKRYGIVWSCAKCNFERGKLSSTYQFLIKVRKKFRRRDAEGIAKAYERAEIFFRVRNNILPLARKYITLIEERVSKKVETIDGVSERWKMIKSVCYMN
jgi:hypothetical protein